MFFTINTLKKISKKNTTNLTFIIKNTLSEIIWNKLKHYGLEVHSALVQTVKVKLETPKRSNQKDYKPQTYIFRKSRKRIETLFSQLSDQFMIKRNYAKSFQGFKNKNSC